MKITLTIPNEIEAQLRAEGVDILDLIRAKLRPFAVRARQARIDVGVAIASKQDAENDQRAAQAIIEAALVQAEADAETLLAGVE